MRIIPNEARLELYGLQEICAPQEGRGQGLDYVDHIWRKRYPDPAPKSTGDWPYKSAKDTPASNVTKLPKRGQK